MQHISGIISIFVAITVLAAVNCQTKPQLPVQLYATVQVAGDAQVANQGLSLPTVWSLWFDNSNPNAPRGKVSITSHSDSSTANSIIIGNNIYQLNLNATGGDRNCYVSIFDKSQMSLFQQALNFLDGATYQGKDTQNGQQCDWWTNTFAGQGSVSGCFLVDVGTPIVFKLSMGDDLAYALNVLEFGARYQADSVFSLPSTGCVSG